MLIKKTAARTIHGKIRALQEKKKGEVFGTVYFKTEKVTDRITRIYAVSSERMYLVEGNEK